MKGAQALSGELPELLQYGLLQLASEFQEFCYQDSLFLGGTLLGALYVFYLSISAKSAAGIVVPLAPAASAAALSPQLLFEDVGMVKEV